MNKKILIPIFFLFVIIALISVFSSIIILLNINSQNANISSTKIDKANENVDSDKTEDEKDNETELSTGEINAIRKLETPEEIVKYYSQNSFADSFGDAYQGTFNWVVVENDEPKNVEVEGWITEAGFQVCLAEGCEQTEIGIVDDGFYVDVDEIYNVLGFEMAPYMTGDGGYNFLDGRQKDNIVCVHYGIVEDPNTQEGELSTQKVMFACGYLEEK